MKSAAGIHSPLAEKESQASGPETGGPELWRGGGVQGAHRHWPQGVLSWEGGYRRQLRRLPIVCGESTARGSSPILSPNEGAVRPRLLRDLPVATDTTQHRSSSTRSLPNTPVLSE